MAFHLRYTKPGSRYIVAVSGLSAFPRCVELFVYIFGNFAFCVLSQELWCKSRTSSDLVDSSLTWKVSEAFIVMVWIKFLEMSALR